MRDMKTRGTGFYVSVFLAFQKLLRLQAHLFAPPVLPEAAHGAYLASGTR